MRRHSVFAHTPHPMDATVSAPAPAPLSAEQNAMLQVGMLQGDYIHFTRSADRIRFTMAFKNDHYLPEINNREFPSGLTEQDLYSIRLPDALRVQLAGQEMIQLSYHGKARYRSERDEMHDAIHLIRERKIFTLSTSVGPLLARAVAVHAPQGGSGGAALTFARKADAKNFTHWMHEHFPNVSLFTRETPLATTGQVAHAVVLPQPFAETVVFPLVVPARHLTPERDSGDATPPGDALSRLLHQGNGRARA